MSKLGDKMVKTINTNSYEETITVETDYIETLKLTHAQDEDLILYNNQEYYNRDNLYLLSTNEITDNKISVYKIKGEYKIKAGGNK